MTNNILPTGWEVLSPAALREPTARCARCGLTWLTRVISEVDGFPVCLTCQARDADPLRQRQQLLHRLLPDADWPKQPQPGGLRSRARSQK